MNKIRRKFFRKLTSLALALSMVLSISPITAWAADAPPTSAPSCEYNYFSGLKLVFALSEDTINWAKAISTITIGDKPYTKSAYSYLSGDTFYVSAKDVGYNEVPYISINQNFLGSDGSVDCVISATGYDDLTLTLTRSGSNYTAEIQSSGDSGGGTEGGNNGGTESGTQIAISDIEISSDYFGSKWYFTFGANNADYISKITGMSVNGAAWESTNYAPSNGGAYYANTSDKQLVIVKQSFGSTPAIQSGDVVTIKANGYDDLTFKCVIDENGNLTLTENDGQGDPYTFHAKLKGSFEAAIVGQKDYDGVSGATGAASSNKNSAVTVYGALVEGDAEPAETDWQELDPTKTNIKLEGSKCSVSIAPDTSKGTSADANSGMSGVYMTISSSLTLDGTPKDAGYYLISVKLTDDQGREATSNALPFRIYAGTETLAEQLVTENLVQTQDGKYMWDIMEPWAITNFGTNVNGEENAVRVPTGLKAWYGSHTSGTYGYLGYDLPWDQVTAGEIPQTLYIPDGCNLTMVNMEILSSVRIVVESGGKLVLRDCSVQGIIDVQDGGTFSMNYDDYGDEPFLTGASISGQLRLADGAILENAAIYSHANYLANGELVDRTTAAPVVLATGNVTVKGHVFIRGDEAAGEYAGQTGLRVEDGALTVEDGALLVVYGGNGKTSLTNDSGTAVELDNGTIDGGGKLVAIAGQAFWGNGGTAVTGTGTVSTNEAILQGATAYNTFSADPGKAAADTVTVSSSKVHLADGTVIDTTENDPLAKLYWKTGIDPVPPLDKFPATESKATQTITAADVTATYGDTDVGVTATATGALSYEVKDGSDVVEVNSSTGALTIKKAGEATITVTAAGTNEYASAAKDISVTIVKKAITVTAQDKSAYVGDVVPVLGVNDFTVTGLVGSDSLTTNPMLAYAVTPDMSKAGTSVITVSGASAGENYTVTHANGTLTISNKSSGGSSAPATYAITVADSTNGSISASKKTAAAGDTVKVAVSPDKGYTLETITVTDKNGKEITLNEKNGTYSFKMPTGAVKVKATFMKDNSMLNFFVDVTAADYFYDSVLWAAENGITKGYDASHFQPDTACSRGQVVTFLWRAAGCPAPRSACPFTDVSASSPYAKAIAWAAEKGIAQGFDATHFRPDSTVSRAQFVTFLWRYEGQPDLKGSCPFTDVSSSSPYYTAILWAAKNGITKGYDASHFQPDTACSRGQVVTFIYRDMA